jgi:hypothetical protein
MLKNPLKYESDRFFMRQNLSFTSPVPPALLLDYSAGRIGIELWWMNQEFSLLITFFHGSPCSYIIWGMNNRPVGSHSSETQSHPIDIIIINSCI